MNHFLQIFMLVILSHLTLKAGIVEETEPNDNLAIACPINFDDTVKCKTSVNDTDCFMITVEQLGYVSFSFSNVTLFGKNPLLATDGITMIDKYCRGPYLLTPGKYFVKLERNSYRPMDTVFTFSVKYTKLDSVLTSDLEPNNNAKTASLIVAGDTLHGVLGAFDAISMVHDSDWAYIEIHREQRLRITRISTGVYDESPINIKMFTENGTRNIQSNSLTAGSSVILFVDSGSTHFTFYSSHGLPYKFNFLFDDSLPIPDTIPRGFDSSICYSSLNASRSSRFDEKAIFSGCQYTKDRQGDMLSALACLGGMGTIRVSTPMVNLSTYTLSFWAKMNTNKMSDFGHMIVVGDSSSYNNYSFAILTDMGGGLTTYFPQGQEMTSLTDIKDSAVATWNGKWAHYVVTRDTRGAGKLFVNGIFVQDIGLRIIPKVTHIYVGNKPGSSWAFRGEIDEIVLLSRAIEPAAIKETYGLVSMLKRGVVFSKNPSLIGSNDVTSYFFLNGRIDKAVLRFNASQLLLKKQKTYKTDVSKCFIQFKR